MAVHADESLFGGGIGTQLVSILDTCPSSKGILFDRPQVIAEGVSHDRIQAISGDFFESVPKGADAYLLRFILHDWDDADAAAILGSVRRSIRPNARLIVVESVIPDGPTFNFGKWTDLQMLVCVGGRERTETEYRTLLSSAGFNLEEVVKTDSPLSLLVAKPVLPESHGGSAHYRSDVLSFVSQDAPRQIRKIVLTLGK